MFRVNIAPFRTPYLIISTREANKKVALSATKDTSRGTLADFLAIIVRFLKKDLLIVSPMGGSKNDIKPGVYRPLGGLLSYVGDLNTSGPGADFMSENKTLDHESTHISHAMVYGILQVCYRT